ncbi:hypothetical protein EV144_107143 [Flavobacterium sp. 270]|uniref:hypothetical protein n=1 Tax=Flavobacterium sp. 270 TaxID=2512114 RepID=UPI0010661A2F|nr:hypothetical protein [Flavobacterium sp. 270]TDW45951.1 hypothetical protein EV144_107143 [Flavobacterium sp. 270]
MKTNITNNIFDLSKFKKIEDIIFLDEPILTHLKRNDKHFFQYLVDTIDESDIYLFLEVDEEEIFQYLTAQKSLRSIIIGNDNIIYLVEQDFNGEIKNITLTQSNHVSDNYLPNDDSFLEYIPTEASYYYSLINEYKSNTYLNSLREKAFYVKFAPLNDKYSDTIGLNELSNTLLSNLSSSFKNFLKADFFNTFKYTKTNKTKLNSIFNKILPDLDFRMVDLKYGSFEVGLAVDKIMKASINDPSIKDWAINVGDKYKELVLDEDYDSEVVDTILTNYSEEDRKKIFNPIFKITENPNFSLQIKESKNSNYSTIKIKDKSVINKIAPIEYETIQTLSNNNKDYQIIQVTTVIDKNNSSKTFKLEDSLFSSTDHSAYVLTNKDFEKYKYNLDFNISIPLDITTDKDKIILLAKYDGIDFNDINYSGKIEDSIIKITQKIYEYILNKE